VAQTDAEQAAPAVGLTQAALQQVARSTRFVRYARADDDWLADAILPRRSPAWAFRAASWLDPEQPL